MVLTGSMADAYSVGGGGGGDDLPLVSDRGAQCVDDALAAARDVGVDVERCVPTTLPLIEFHVNIPFLE